MHVLITYSTKVIIVNTVSIRRMIAYDNNIKAKYYDDITTNSVIAANSKIS
ncbi:MAG: hypothetical protein WAK17_25620 [Candidatus Nitrosopolaris sp.]|jgi:hypothetical protein